jgi:hypothetical protein
MNGLHGTIPTKHPKRISHHKRLVLLPLRLLASGYNVTDIANAIIEVQEVQRQRQETMNRMRREGESFFGNLTHWMVPPVFTRKEDTVAVPPKTTLPQVNHKSVSARSA